MILLLIVSIIFSCSDVEQKEIKESIPEYELNQNIDKKNDSITFKHSEGPLFKELFSLELGQDNFFPNIDMHNAHIPTGAIIENDTLFLLDRVSSSIYSVSLSNGSFKRKQLAEDWPISFSKSEDIKLVEFPHFFTIKANDTTFNLNSKTINKPKKVLALRDEIVFINNDSLYQFNLRSNKKRIVFNSAVSQFVKCGGFLYVVSKDGNEIYKISVKSEVVKKELVNPIVQYESYIEDCDGSNLLIFNQWNNTLRVLDFLKEENKEEYEIENCLPAFMQQEELEADLFPEGRTYYSYFKFYKGDILWIAIIGEKLKVFQLKT